MPSPLISADELGRRLDGQEPPALLDIRWELVGGALRDAYAAGHIPGAMHVPRGQLELGADSVFPDPTVRVIIYCEFGKISTIATATMRTMGFAGAIALDGGMKAWREAGHPVEQGPPAKR